MEVEDDVFFAELSRRISLLIMDDDDEAPVASYHPSVSLQDFSVAMHPTAQSLPFMYEQTTCKRESKGTGVFIPQSPQWRRKNRHGRFNSFNTKSHKQPENTRGVVVSHVAPYNNNSNPPYSFNNPTK